MNIVRRPSEMAPKPGRQRIMRARRQYNQWVANETLEDYALRFTAEKARRWSHWRVANTALGAISFLASEAFGGALTLAYGFSDTASAICVVSLLMFLTGFPITYYATRAGLDIDLLTRGAGFGYIGSTITSLIYASFTFIFFAVEAAIMAMALQLCFGIPIWAAYAVSTLVIIPVSTHGMLHINRLQNWTQPVWLILQFAPLAYLVYQGWPGFHDWTTFTGVHGNPSGAIDLTYFGLAATLLLSLIPQVGEQVDYLRFMPNPARGHPWRWWFAVSAAGTGWILIGGIKLFAGSFLAYIALKQGLPPDRAAEPPEIYRIAFLNLLHSPTAALIAAGVLVIVCQTKINVTNAYAGSLAWSNFFARLTHSHPGRVVWLIFNTTLALLLMEFGVFDVIAAILGFYANFAVAWIGALTADLVVNKPLGFSPPFIEFKRAHLYDINPVGVGAMGIAIAVSTPMYLNVFGPTAHALATFASLFVAFLTAPIIAWATKGRYYIARAATDWKNASEIRCCICENSFEPPDMSFCPAYDGPICSLCCSLDARCHDLCKEKSRLFGSGP